MSETIYASVFQESRFIKVITTEGKDISNQVDRSIRKEAIARNCGIKFENGSWSLDFAASSPKSAAEATQTVEQPPVDADTQIIKDFIHKSGSMKPKQLIMSDLKWKYLVRSAMRGKNIMMTGPAGTGKTIAAKTLVQALERPDFYFNLGATQDPRATLIGNTHFNKEEGTYFSESLFVKAIQTENAVILLDELSRAHPEAWNILMTVLDLNQRYLRLDEKDGSPTIKVAKGVSFIATANIGNEYTSTRRLDRALEDRFVTIEMDMLDEDMEASLLAMKYPTVDKKLLRSVAAIGSATRKEVKSVTAKLTNMRSTRAAVEVASLLEDGFTLAEAAEVAIYPFFSEDGGIDSERTFVKQLVQKYCVDPEAEKDEALFSEEEIESTPF
jgi:nitric oxide reductase NorQ protein